MKCLENGYFCRYETTITMNMKHIYCLGFFVILFLICGCHFKKGTREEVIWLYEQGKKWEKAAQADSAVAYFSRSFQLAKELKEDSLIGDIGNTLGDILRLQYFYEYAYSVHQEAYLYNIKLRDKTAASHSLRGIGKDYMFNFIEDSIIYRKRQDSALVYFHTAESLIPQIKSRREITSIYNNLCCLYVDLKDYTKALNYNQRSINCSKDKIELYKNYSLRAKICFNLQFYDSSVYYCKQAMLSENLYTQHSACHQLFKTLSRMGNADSAFYLKKTFEIHDLIEQQNRKGGIMQFFQKATQEQIEKEKNILFFCTVFVLILLSISIFILYRKHNRKKLLKKDHVIFSQREKLITEQKQTRNLFKKLEEITKISNYAELKEQRLNEEAKIVSKLIYLGNEYATSFRKDPFYEKIMDDLNGDFSNEERECLFRKVNQYFTPYIQEVSKYIQLADEDYFVCCLTLLGFSTKYCAICRGVGEAAIRVQRKRIKEKLKGFFHSDKFYNSIFARRDT